MQPKPGSVRPGNPSARLLDHEDPYLRHPAVAGPLPSRRAERRNADFGYDRPCRVEGPELLATAPVSSERDHEHGGQGQERRLDQRRGPLG